jgi:hypothetical protein
MFTANEKYQRSKKKIERTRYNGTAYPLTFALILSLTHSFIFSEIEEVSSFLSNVITKKK